MKTTSTGKKAERTISSSSTYHAPKTPGFAFCESVHATSYSHWHIRSLDAAGLKLGGGITSPSLCELVTRGWDLDVEITEHHLQHSCKRCVVEYLKLKSTS